MSDQLRKRAPWGAGVVTIAVIAVAAAGSAVYVGTSVHELEPAAAAATPGKGGGGANPGKDPYAAMRSNAGDDSFLFANINAKGNGRVARGNKDALATFQMARPAGAFSALPANGDPVKGTFSPVVDWPLIGIHAVLTPDGRVLTYGTTTAGVRTGYYSYDIWDPLLGLGSASHTVLPNTTAVDLFCNAQLLLPDGNIEMWGGDIVNLSTGKSRLLPTDDTNVFYSLNNNLARTGKMKRPRWYATATTLPNGEVYIQGGDGGGDYPEVRTSTGNFRLLTGAPTGHLSRLYPRNFVAPDGKIFGIISYQMYRVDPSGTGSFTSLGSFDKENRSGSSTAVMFRPGFILQVGGGKDDLKASLKASQIDIRGATPIITDLPPMKYRRHWGTATVMADGRVFVSGGSTANNLETSGVAYTSEIYDPKTNSWSLGATAQQMRLYHSSSLLLPDATVLTLGGGAVGPQLNLNAEIYYPPYLFNADGTPAARPTISSVPMAVNPGEVIRIGTPTVSNIERVTLLKSGSVTHSFDMDQRFLELPFTISGGELRASLPANSFDTPPGYYLVFIINKQGVPSEATPVRINIAGQTPAPAPATLTITKVVINDNGGTKVASDFTFSVNGATPVAFAASGSNTLSVPAGSYSVTEPAVAGYAASLSGCTNIVLPAGGSATCTITNNDVAAAPASLTVTKVVVNDNGGTKVASDFTFSVNGATPVAFAASGSNTLSVPAGTYSVTEPAVAGYAASLSGCTNIVLPAGGSATCTITNNDQQVSGTNLIVNGDFEIHNVRAGDMRHVSNLLGWKSTTGLVEIYCSYVGFPSGLNNCHMETDPLENVSNQTYQDIATVAGATYDLSFLQSPRPEHSADRNAFEVYWNDTLVATIARNGSSLTTPNWQRTHLVVTGTGADRLWFREYDTNKSGAFIDDVQLIQR